MKTILNPGFVLILGLLLAAACSTKKDDVKPVTPPTLPGDSVITGKWLLYETGSSDGSIYTTVSVPVSPPQTMQFKSDSTFVSNIEGFEEIHFYSLSSDPFGKVVSLYLDQPATTPVKASYYIIWDNGHLRLIYRWCTEGCHLAFTRVNE